MTTNWVTIPLLLLLLLAAPATASAADVQDGARPRPTAVEMRVLRLFDANRDGRFDEHEVRSMKNALRALRRHGRQAPEHRRDRLHTLRERLDANGNGRIDRDERATLRERLKERRGKAGDASRVDRPRRRAPTRS